MSLRNVKRMGLWLVLAGVLAVLLSAPAWAQDTREQEEELSWYEKFTTSEGVQQQFESNPVLFLQLFLPWG